MYPSRILTKHPLLTFAIMMGASLAFGLSSYNIYLAAIPGRLHNHLSL
jgi:hypothetical protein